MKEQDLLLELLVVLAIFLQLYLTPVELISRTAAKTRGQKTAFAAHWIRHRRVARKPVVLLVKRGAKLADGLAGVVHFEAALVRISVADPPDVSPRRGRQPSPVRSAYSRNSSGDERGDLKDGTVGKLGGDASTRRGVASSTRQICATSEAANSTLLTPSAGTVSQVRCEVTRVRQRRCGHYRQISVCMVRRRIASEI